MVEIIFAFFLGVGITAGVYEVIYEFNQKRSSKLISKKFINILEGASMRIYERSKILKRDLTEKEKDKVIDEYYNEYNENNVGVIQG